VLITDLARCLIEEKPFQAQQRPDHVFADSLCLSFRCSPDLAVDVETCVAPAEDLLHQGKPDELFPKQQGEDLMSEDFLNDLVMKTANAMESTIRRCASFCNQDMDMRMEVDSVTEGLDHSHYPWHKLKACGCVQKFHKRTYRTEAEIIEEFSLVPEEKTQHLRDGEDNLPVRDIQEKFLPHPLTPLLSSLSMTGGTESACLAGKHQEPLFPTVRAPNAGKAAHRIAAVEILLNDILDYRTEIPELLLEPILIFS
jgi:hypothetical protein